uniref:Uncharacterized protein n=1 Tax=Mycena chlorophos TaxID=658473 RepID=A0ABQ0L908_MYCCL|nr:predicted protein [Mycena chlorophos]
MRGLSTTPSFLPPPTHLARCSLRPSPACTASPLLAACTVATSTFTPLPSPPVLAPYSVIRRHPPASTADCPVVTAVLPVVTAVPPSYPWSTRRSTPLRRILHCDASALVATSYLPTVYAPSYRCPCCRHRPLYTPSPAADPVTRRRPYVVTHRQLTPVPSPLPHVCLRRF